MNCNLQEVLKKCSLKAEDWWSSYVNFVRWRFWHHHQSIGQHNYKVTMLQIRLQFLCGNFIFKYEFTFESCPLKIGEQL